MFNTPEDQQQWLDETIAKISIQVSRRTPQNTIPSVHAIKEAYHNAFENPLSEEYAHLIRDEYIRLAREKVNLMVETELIIEPKPDLVVDMTPDRIVAEPKESAPTSGPFPHAAFNEAVNENHRLVRENVALKESLARRDKGAAALRNNNAALGKESVRLRTENASLRANLTEAEGKLRQAESTCGVGSEYGLVAALHDEQTEALALPLHASDGSAHLTYFDNETQASFNWDGDTDGYVQVSYGGYGEPSAAGFSISRFDRISDLLVGDTPEPSDASTETFARFKKACDAWLTLLDA